MGARVAYGSDFGGDYTVNNPYTADPKDSFGPFNLPKDLVLYQDVYYQEGKNTYVGESWGFKKSFPFIGNNKVIEKRIASKKTEGLPNYFWREFWNWIHRFLDFHNCGMNDYLSPAFPQYTAIRQYHKLAFPHLYRNPSKIGPTDSEFLWCLFYGPYIQFVGIPKLNVIIDPGFAFFYQDYAVGGKNGAGNRVIPRQLDLWLLEETTYDMKTSAKVKELTPAPTTTTTTTTTIPGSTTTTITVPKTTTTVPRPTTTTSTVPTGPKQTPTTTTIPRGNQTPTTTTVPRGNQTSPTTSVPGSGKAPSSGNVPGGTNPNNPGGNSSGNSGSGSESKTTTRTITSVVPEDYTKYIQYTLNKVGTGKLVIDGLFDSETHKAVEFFQMMNSQSYVDGIVDSETKSVLAFFWLDLYKNQKDKYDLYLNGAPSQVKKYIQAAVKYSDIANIGRPGREYRRISFTGVAGPTEIVDYLIMQVPQKAERQKLHSITISTGAWPARIEGVYLYDTELGIRDYFTGKEKDPIPGIPHVYSPSGNADIRDIPAKSTAKPSAKITLSKKGIANIKYVMIKVVGKKLDNSKLGPNAEGFSIKDIKFGISAEALYVPPTYGTIEPFMEAMLKGSISGSVELQSSDEIILDFNTISNLVSKSVVDNISFENLSMTITNSGVTKNIVYTVPEDQKIRYSSSVNRLNESLPTFTYDGVDITTNPAGTSYSLRETSPSISSVYKLTGTSEPTLVNNSDFSLSPVSGRSNSYLLKVLLGIQFESKESSPETEVNVSSNQDIYLADADNIASRQNVKKTINVRDGIVVLTDSNGLAAGMPNMNRPMSSSNSVISYGFINLMWNHETPSPYGLDWGFYNIQTRKFLGKKISYYEYDKIHGAKNVYICANAYDSDMDQGTKDNIVGEPNRNSQLKESARPTRYICPVYSVKVIPRSKIAVTSPPSNLNKYDTWHINVGMGRFTKFIDIPMNYNFTNWLKEYKDKTLRCFYDTTKIKLPTSSIFGTGYYDIYDEHPIYVSDNEILLRYGSVHCTQEQVDILLPNTEEWTDASPTVPWLFVKIKNTKGDWIDVPRKKIKSFDKNSGLITFTEEIVPFNMNDMKVNYTIKNSNAMLHQINGQSLGLNPFLALENNKPIFIYLTPVKIEEYLNGSFIEVQTYTNRDAINFTNDSTMFDQRSNKYDPLALHIATISVNNFYSFENVNVEDMRVKGGGLKHSTNIQTTFEESYEVASYADLYTGKGYAHANGGYVIIKLPKEVINNFSSKDEVYNIIRNNLTAGVSFDIQDVEGNDWRMI